MYCARHAYTAFQDVASIPTTNDAAIATQRLNSFRLPLRPLLLTLRIILKCRVTVAKFILAGYETPAELYCTVALTSLFSTELPQVASNFQNKSVLAPPLPL